MCLIICDLRSNALVVCSRITEVIHLITENQIKCVQLSRLTIVLNNVRYKYQFLYTRLVNKLCTFGGWRARIHRLWATTNHQAEVTAALPPKKVTHYAWNYLLWTRVINHRNHPANRLAIAHPLCCNRKAVFPVSD